MRIGQGQKGPEVTEVIEVDMSTAQLGSSPQRRSATPSQVVGQTKECIGTVKMYKTAKGFGFLLFKTSSLVRNFVFAVIRVSSFLWFRRSEVALAGRRIARAWH